MGLLREALVMVHNCIFFRISSKMVPGMTELESVAIAASGRSYVVAVPGDTN